MKVVAIVQSNYIPWKGYFDLINLVDEFILFDDVQYTVRDWRNRNVIKTAQGPQWLSIPVHSRGLRDQLIRDTLISDPEWRFRHWKTLVQAYGKCPHFADCAPWLEQAYQGADDLRLSQVNRLLIEAICRFLGISTTINASMSYRVSPGKTERLVDLCLQAQANVYVSGPAARSYIDPSLFEEAGIELAYFDYSGYCEYPQRYPPFLHNVTALDMLFNVGADAGRLLKTAPLLGMHGDDAQKRALLAQVTAPA